MDVFRFNARSSTIDITARQLGNNPEVELYQVDQKLGRTLRKIGRTDFNAILPRQRDRFLSAVNLASTGGKNNKTYTADVESGNFVLVVSSSASKSRKYNLRFVASPLESTSAETSNGNEGSDVTPDSTLDNPSGSTPSTSPSTSPGASPSTSPGASPSTSPGASPSASPGASPSASPNASPSSTPNLVATPPPSNPPGTDTIGNTIDAAKLITLGNSESERIGGTDPFDFFRFELSDRQKVSLTLQGLSENADLALLNSSGGELRVSNGAGTTEDSILRTLDQGTYYIRVSSTSTTETAYTLATSSAATIQRALYSPNGSTTPGASQELQFVQLPFTNAEAMAIAGTVGTNTAFSSERVFGQLQSEGLVATTNATETVVAKGVQLDTRVNNSNTGYVGYTNHTIDYSAINPVNVALTGNLTADLEPVSANGLPVLDADVGYTVSFEVAINTETSNSSDRAGFSILVVSSDGQRAIELGFNNTDIFAQSQNLTAENRITPSGFAMSDFVAYDLRVVGSGYELFANGSRLMSGNLQQPYNFDPRSSDPALPFNPYTSPNFIFLGDNTDQASATFTLGKVSVST